MELTVQNLMAQKETYKESAEESTSRTMDSTDTGHKTIAFKAYREKGSQSIWLWCDRADRDRCQNRERQPLSSPHSATKIPAASRPGKTLLGLWCEGLRAEGQVEWRGSVPGFASGFSTQPSHMGALEKPAGKLQTEAQTKAQEDLSNKGLAGRSIRTQRLCLTASAQHKKTAPPLSVCVLGARVEGA